MVDSAQGISDELNKTGGGVASAAVRASAPVSGGNDSAGLGGLEHPARHQSFK
jgi:hypothetical protein